jgi:hypothetical protein
MRRHRPRRLLLIIVSASVIIAGSPMAASARTAPSAPSAMVSDATSLSTSSLQVVDPEAAFARAATWLTAHNGGPVPYSMKYCFPGFSLAPCAVLAVPLDRLRTTTAR